MPATISPPLTDLYTAVKAFLVDILPVDPDFVIQGLGNRTAMPAGPCVVMTAILNGRLRTNQVTWDENDPAPTELTAEQGVQVTMQIDCYGSDSMDWAEIIATLWRDDYGCTALAPTCQPLFSDDPRQIPLIDSEMQYEARWLVSAQLQYNPVVSTPSQFADTLSVALVNVDEKFPPT